MEYSIICKTREHVACSVMGACMSLEVQPQAEGFKSPCYVVDDPDLAFVCGGARTPVRLLALSSRLSGCQGTRVVRLIHYEGRVT